MSARHELGGYECFAHGVDETHRQRSAQSFVAKPVVAGLPPLAAILGHEAPLALSRSASQLAIGCDAFVLPSQALLAVQ